LSVRAVAEPSQLADNAVCGSVANAAPEVCPWNSSKFVQITGEPDFDGRERDRGARTSAASEEGLFATFT
jgi:hypothetical protein